MENLLMEILSPDRLCKHCKKSLGHHLEIYRNLCHYDNPTRFEPMDNLTYIEHLAKERGLI